MEATNNATPAQWDDRYDQSHWASDDFEQWKTAPDRNKEYYAQDKFGRRLINRHGLTKSLTVWDVTPGVQIVGDWDFKYVQAPNAGTPAPKDVWQVAQKYGVTLRALSNDKGEIIIGAAPAHGHLPNKYTWKYTGRGTVVRSHMNPGRKEYEYLIVEGPGQAEFYKDPAKLLSPLFRNLMHSGLCDATWRVTRVPHDGRNTMGEWVSGGSREVSDEQAKSSQEESQKRREWEAGFPARRFMYQQRGTKSKSGDMWQLPRESFSGWLHRKITG